MKSGQEDEKNLIPAPTHFKDKSYEKREPTVYTLTFQNCQPRSINVVNQFGKVKRLHCPFRVLAIVDIPPDIAEGKFYMVDFVKITLNLKEVFIIQGMGYFICHFKIM